MDYTQRSAVHGDVTRHTARSLTSRRLFGIIQYLLLCYIEFEENNQESRSPLWSRERRTSAAAAADTVRRRGVRYGAQCGPMGCTKNVVTLLECPHRRRSRRYTSVSVIAVRRLPSCFACNNNMECGS